MKSLIKTKLFGLLKPLIQSYNKLKTLVLTLFFVFPFIIFSQEQLQVIPDNSFIEVGKMSTGLNQKDKWIKRAKKLGATHYYVESSVLEVENYLNKAGRNATFKGSKVRFYKRDDRMDEYWEKVSEAVDRTKQRNEKWFIEKGKLYCEVTNGNNEFISKCTFDKDSILNGPCKTQKIKYTREKKKKQFYNDRLGIWEERDVVYDYGDIILPEYTISNYVNGEKNGSFVEYDKNGIKKAEGNYIDGIRDGPYITYYSTGDVLKKMYHANGVIQGPTMTYYEDGKISGLGNYVDGKLDGPYINYYHNGKISEEKNYEKGLTVGNYTRYYENGNKKEEYIHNGFHSFYSEDGQILKRWRYSYGYNKVGVFKNLDSKGRVISEGFLEGKDTIVKNYSYFRESAIKEYKIKDFDYNKIYEVKITNDGWQTYKRLIYYPSGNLQEEKTFFYPPGKYSSDLVCGESFWYKDKKNLILKEKTTHKRKCPKTH